MLHIYSTKNKTINQKKLFCPIGQFKKSQFILLFLITKRKDLPMTKKISFLFICLMAFALGYSINNLAISDTAPKIAVVDVQRLIQNSSQVKQLKADQEKKITEMQNTIQKAQTEISKETDPAKVSALEEKYRNQINDQKNALDKEYNDKLTKIDSEIRASVVEKARSLNYSLVLPKNVVFFGGDDITDAIAKGIK